MLSQVLQYWNEAFVVALVSSLGGGRERILWRLVPHSGLDLLTALVKEHSVLKRLPDPKWDKEHPVSSDRLEHSQQIDKESDGSA